MAQRIKLPDRDPNVRVELGSQKDGSLTEYRMRPVTMEIEEELDQLQRESLELEANPDSKPIDLCEAEVRQLDIVLEPLPRPDGDSGSDPTPSELLIPSYKNGDVTRSQIRHMVGRIVASARPT